MHLSYGQVAFATQPQKLVGLPNRVFLSLGAAIPLKAREKRWEMMKRKLAHEVEYMGVYNDFFPIPSEPTRHHDEQKVEREGAIG